MLQHGCDRFVEDFSPSAASLQTGGTTRPDVSGGPQHMGGRGRGCGADEGPSYQALPTVWSTLQ